MNPIDVGPSSLFKSGIPRRKTAVLIEEDLIPGNIYVVVSLQLSKNNAVEERAILENGTDQLVLSYQVEIDLDSHRRNLISCLEEIYRDHPNFRQILNNPFPNLTLEETLMPLAQRGADVFRRLFYAPDALTRERTESAKVKLHALQSAWARNQLVAISSPVPLFPWAFLYSGLSLEKDKFITLNPKFFWGFQHEIQDLPPNITLKVKFPEKPEVVAAVCTETDQGRHFANDHPFNSDEIKLRHVSDAAKLRTELTNFDADCLYFYGHAHQDDPPVAVSSYLELNSVRLTVSEMTPCFHREPVLIFLNGCDSASFSHWNRETVIGALCKLSNEQISCVATTAKVPETVAAEFAKHFWKYFIIEKTHLGTALLKARTKLFNLYRNPLGLVYTIFGRIDTKISSS